MIFQVWEISAVVDAGLFVKRGNGGGAGDFSAPCMNELDRQVWCGLLQHRAHHFAALIGFRDNRIRIPVLECIGDAGGPAVGGKTAGGKIGEDVACLSFRPGGDNDATFIAMGRYGRVHADDDAGERTRRGGARALYPIAAPERGLVVFDQFGIQFLSA